MAASAQTEWQFVACFWRLALGSDPSVVRVAKYVRPEMLQIRQLGTIYGLLLDRFAAGTLQDDQGTQFELSDVLGNGGIQTVQDLYTEAVDSAGLKIEPYAREIYRWWQAGRAAKHLTEAAGTVGKLALEDPREAVKHAELALYEGIVGLREHHPEAGPQSRKEFAELERAKLDAKGVIGAPWPYPKMQRVLGHIRPGKVYGISALPGIGKSTLLANLFVGFARRGQPVIVAPTEMRDEWLSRAYAAAARVPQEIAENALWDHTDPDVVNHLAEVWEIRGAGAEGVVEGKLRTFREHYRQVIDEFEKLPWEVIAGADLSIDEVIVRLGILRRRYPGKFVIAAIDHMHNLAYPNGETDKHVGPASKRLRDFCMDDADGGMAVIALYQPRKPEKEPGADSSRFRPLPAHEIRGQVAQVLDIHMSIFHRMVKVDPGGRTTAWGTPAGQTDPDTGLPVFPKRGEDCEVKEDDERIYVKPDKRRRHGGSRSSSSFILNINAETGEIVELDRRRHLQAV